jgi:4-hydroxybenzoyl-CoA reductase alpha subunit
VICEDCGINFAKIDKDEKGLTTMEYSVVGKNSARRGAMDKATGRAQFTADLTLPNMLYGKILRSPYPHARILNIDISRAAKLVGVRGIITGKDIPRVQFGGGEGVCDRYSLAIEKVRFIGDEVAAVAGIDEDTAEEALDLIKVDYEELPSVFDPEEAMKPGAPKIHDKKNNINVKMIINAGDVEKGFRESFYIHEDRFTTQVAIHCALEPHVSLAKFDNESITIWTSTQMPFVTRYWLAKTLGLPENKVRVIKPYVGGAFGGKIDLFSHEICACLLSIKTGRPVKIELTREEVFTCTRSRHPMIIELKTGVRRDGTIIAKQCRHILDGGAYGGAGIAAPHLSLLFQNLPYKFANAKLEAYRVYTNNPVSGAMRGYTSPQVHFADECHMDMIAEALGIDPIEIRLKNAIDPNYSTATMLKITSCGFTETIQEAARAIGWDKSKGKVRKNRGIGMGCSGFLSGSAFAILNTPKNYSSCVIIKLHREGFATVFTGASDIGQGSDTVLGMIAAEELGLSPENVRVVSGDTELTPFDSGAFGSRTTFLVGNAVKRAATEAKQQLFKAVSERLEASIEDLESKEGRIFVKGNPEKGMSFGEAVFACQELAGGTEIVGRGTFSFEIDASIYETGLGNYCPSYSFSTGTAKVEVDRKTGLVDVIKVVFAHDIGYPINPVSVEGQLQGSILMGYGFTLLEQALLKKGRILNPSFLDYMVPTALDMPEIEIALVKTNDPGGPFGAKECGEGSTSPVSPCIANAIYDAIGLRIKELPITPEKILKALKITDNNAK